MAAKTDRVVTYLEELIPTKLLRSCDSLKIFYLHFHSVYGHQTWQDDNLPWGIPSHKVIWPFDHFILQNRVINEKEPLATKLDRVLTFFRGLLPLKAHGLGVTWSYLHYHKSYGYQNWQKHSLPCGACTYNVTLSLITWSCEVTWQIIYIISPLALDQWIPNMTRFYVSPGPKIVTSGSLERYVCNTHIWTDFIWHLI